MRVSLPAVEAPLAWTSRARYRVRQFFQGLVARVEPHELALATQALPPEAAALFLRLPVDVQRHSLNVLAAVHERGFYNADLDAAALLHDAGKLAADEAGVRLGPWLRGPLVLLEAFAPARLYSIARDDPARGRRYAVYVYLEHPRLGAERAQQAGCSDLTCRLIRHHQDDPALTGGGESQRRLLVALQAADDSC